MTYGMERVLPNLFLDRLTNQYCLETTLCTYVCCQGKGYILRKESSGVISLFHLYEESIYFNTTLCSLSSINSQFILISYIYLHNY